MRRALVEILGIAALAACTAEPLRDRPEGMLAPFPADEDGREVPHERMVPHLVREAVALAVARPPVPPAAPRAGAPVDLRNEPVLVLSASGAAGIGAPWPQDRTFTLRPPTRAELTITPLGKLDARTSWDGWQAALAWLRAEAGRPRPGLQRYTETVLIVADGSSAAEDARAAAAVLTRMGAARRARIAVVGPGGPWGALPLAPATLPVPALEDLAARARSDGSGHGAPEASSEQRARSVAGPAGRAGEAARGEGDPPADEVRRRLEAALAQPIPGPRCVEVEVSAPAAVRAAVEAALADAGPQDVVAVRGFSPTLAQHLDPASLAGAALAPRVRLGDRCE